MALDQDAIYLGVPDQLTTGAVSTADPKAIPVKDINDGTFTARTVLDEKWTASGYITDAGITLSQSRSTSSLKDWSGAAVRTLLDEFTGTISYAEMQTDKVTMERMVGAGNVKFFEANSEHGDQMAVGIGPELPPSRSFTFSMKDGDRRMRIYVPNGQVTSVADAAFVNNAAVAWNFTVSCSDDGTGHSIYILTDDGQVVVASTPVGGE